MHSLLAAFLHPPIAHRGLHGPGVPENSLAAFEAAAQAGYAIECDIQRTADGSPVVFHDDDLKRLVGDARRVADCLPQDLARLRLLGSDQPVPTLRNMLDHVAGRVPLLVEIKDQDGQLGGNIGDLQDRVAELLSDYDGPVAVMSFNPETMVRFQARAPGIPAGLVTDAFEESDWPQLDAAKRRHLAMIGDFGRSGVGFISHNSFDLGNPAVARLKARGVPVLCWTVRSAAQEAVARKSADNITFEGYRPVI